MKILCIVVSVLAVSTAAPAQPDASGHPVVTTTLGKVRGNRTTLQDGTTVDAFYNIPYAKPPTGDRRFSRPEAVETWTTQGVLDATGALRYQCPQGPWIALMPVEESFPNSEDCLVLNIYAPETSSDASPLPVMFWIHGGGLMLGTSHSYDGKQLAAKGVVVVTANYRVDSLGFLSTEDAASPGNYGLWDLIRALEWVRDSISAFNGNPSDVTVFGESAGAYATSLLVQSKETSGLFQKAIMQSGSPLTMGRVTDNPRLSPSPLATARRLAQHVGCDQDDTSQMIACLRTKDSSTLSEASTALTTGLPDPFIFKPVPETTFGLTGVLSAAPITVLDQGTFHNITTIRGCNSQDSFVFIFPYDADDHGFGLQQVQGLVHQQVETLLDQTNLQVDKAELETELMNLYFNNITDPRELRNAYAEMNNDFTFWVPAILEVQLATRFPVKPQYFYRFSYRSANRLSPKWIGTTHADELDYVFGSPVSGHNIMANFVSSWTNTDRQMSETMMTLWTNFVKFGDPTPGSGVNGVKWSPWTHDSQRVLDITDQLRMRDDLVTPKVTLWLEKLQAVLRARSGASQPGIIG